LANYKIVAILDDTRSALQYTQLLLFLLLQPSTIISRFETSGDANVYMSKIVGTYKQQKYSGLDIVLSILSLLHYITKTSYSGLSKNRNVHMINDKNARGKIVEINVLSVFDEMLVKMRRRDIFWKTAPNPGK